MNNELEKFFLVIPPGLEKVALFELQNKTDITGKSTYGGIEIECPLSTGHQLNSILKIPNRILKRVSTVRCRDFPKLFNKMKKIQWNKILSSSNISFSISSTNSRLFDSRKIEKSAGDGIKKYFESNTPPKKICNGPQQQIFLRFYNDNLTISIDTSGERLHKRGYRTHIGVAPLRENIASALVIALSKQCQNPTKLIDPLCGSGTLLLEAALFNSPITTREYLYPINSSLPYKSIPLPFSEYIGKDIEPSNISIAKENSMVEVSYEIEDLFSHDKTQTDQTVICNPPYGKRIKLTHSLQEYVDQIIRKYKPETFGIILPKTKIKLPRTYKKIEVIEFENGGIEVEFLIARKITGSSN